MVKRARIKGKGAAIFLGEETPTLQQDSKTAKQYTVKTVNTSKATFYLPANLIDELEDVWLTLRKTYKQQKVTKSKIVQIALGKIFEDWKMKQDESILINQLIE